MWKIEKKAKKGRRRKEERRKRKLWGNEIDQIMLYAYTNMSQWALAIIIDIIHQ